MPDLAVLNDALDESRRRGRERLRDLAIVHEPVRFDPIEPVRNAFVSPLVKSSPKAATPFGDRQSIKRHKLAMAFKEPALLKEEKKRSDDLPKKPRDYGCKERPKHNRPSGRGGGGIKRFIPWC